MICYKDMTFCDYWRDCGKNLDCHRKLTDYVKDKAKKYDLPICEFSDKPDCWEKI